MIHRFLSAFGLILLILTGCTPKHSDIIVSQYGDYDIKMGEFEKAYAKNVGGVEKAVDDSQSEYQNFLDLYLDYKMKLRDAQVRRYQDDPKMKEEINDYKKKVGAAYIIERNLVDKAVRQLYERREYEVRVSHIMIRQDTITAEQAKNKAAEIIKKINNGEDFNELAKQYSEDTFSKNLGGDIYYLTAGQINIPDFEDAIYNTPVGEIYPEPVHSRYGFHVIKVTDKQKRRYKIHARHILIDFQTDEGDLDTAAARAKIEEIYQMLKSGVDFADVAKKYSEDKGTAPKGGDLGYFERRNMVKEFDEAAFKLKVNEISPIVKTKYGFHIIQLLDEKPYPTFKEDEENLKTLYKKTRYNGDFNKLISKFKKKYNYQFNRAGIDRITYYSDSTRISRYYDSEWRQTMKDTAVFFIDGNPYTLESLVDAVRYDAMYKDKFMVEPILMDAVNKVSGDLLIERASLDLDKTDPYFSELMDEYQNGIYIFKIQEEEIWDKINIDSTKIYDFWNSTKENYKWKDRVEFREIFSKSDSLIKVYYQRLLNGAGFDTLASRWTERKGMQFKWGYHGIKNAEDNVLTKKANSLNNPNDFSEPFDVGDGWSIVQLVKKYPAGLKTFKEAKAEAASILQEKESKRLEEIYLNKLRSIYEPELYYNELEDAFKPSTDN